MRSMAYVPVPGPCISPGLSSARYTLILEMPRTFAIAVGPLSLRTKRHNRISADRRLAALVDPFAFAIPSNCLSRRRVVSNSANTPSMPGSISPLQCWYRRARAEGGNFWFWGADDVLEIAN